MDHAHCWTLHNRNPGLVECLTSVEAFDWRSFSRTAFTASTQRAVRFECFEWIDYDLSLADIQDFSIPVTQKSLIHATEKGTGILSGAIGTMESVWEFLDHATDFLQRLFIASWLERVWDCTWIAKYEGICLNMEYSPGELLLLDSTRKAKTHYSGCAHCTWMWCESMSHLPV